MIAPVRIRSKWHPDGRLYSFVDVGDLGADKLERLMRLHVSVASRVDRAKKRGRFVANLQGSRALGQAVVLLLPDLEPRVLRRLPDEARCQVLQTWAQGVK